jgi:hypothetical protein
MNVYDKALEDLRENGHHKGDFYADLEKPWTSAACLRGALHRVNGSALAAAKATTAISTTGEGLLEDIVAEQFPDRLAPAGRSVLAHFNDHDDTTVDEVFTVLEKASLIEDEKVA